MSFINKMGQNCQIKCNKIKLMGNIFTIGTLFLKMPAVGALFRLIYVETAVLSVLKGTNILQSGRLTCQVNPLYKLTLLWNIRYITMYKEKIHVATDYSCFVFVPVA